MKDSTITVLVLWFKRMKVKVLSPVHVGTGELIDCYCYEASGIPDVINRYDQVDVIATIPSEKLLDERNLKTLSFNSKGEKAQEKRSAVFLQHAKYEDIKPKYQLTCKTSLNYFQTAEQVKSVNRPYIPGSSVKGAIMHALLYRTVKENYTESGIETYITNERKLNRINVKNVFDMILGDRNAYAVISGFLLCEDIFFDKIGLYDCFRLNSNAPMSNFEAIVPGQIAECQVFTIHKDRVETYRNSADQINNKVKEFLDHLNEQYILESLQILAKDNIRIEQEYEYDLSEISDQLNQLKFAAEKSPIIRIGGSTNYWEKSIAYLAKANNPQFYKENFDNVFSPIRPGKNTRRKLDPELMPKTRVLLDDGTRSYLAGYLEILNEH